MLPKSRIECNKREVMLRSQLYQVKESCIRVKINLCFLPRLTHYTLTVKEHLMNFWAELGLALRQAIRQGRLSIDELAREMGVSTNLLYQNANYYVTGQGKPPTLETALMVIDRQRSWKILKLIARRFGYALVKVRGRKAAEDGPEALVKLHKRYLTVTERYSRFVRAGESERKGLMEALHESMEYEMSVTRRLAGDPGQLELFNDK